MDIQYWDIGRLRPYEANPRENGNAIPAVAESIRRFGFTVPVVADGDGVVIAGHTRLYAARSLGMERVPVVVASDLTEAQARALRIADNRVAEMATWDREALDAELRAIGDAFDMAGLGFLAEAAKPVESLAEDSSALPPPETRPGQIYRLGPHVLMCGDSTRREDVEALTEGAKADMCFTDPPYNVAYTGATRDRMTIENDALGKEFPGFLERAMRQAVSHTLGAIYVCMGSSELGALERGFLAAGGATDGFAVWEKNAFTLGRSDYQRQYEPILLGHPDGSPVPRFARGTLRERKPVRNGIHPTMKPVGLVRRAVIASSREGDTVLDLFGGGGSTLVACEGTGRRARLMEIDPRYCDAIVRRWKELREGGVKCG